MALVVSQLGLERILKALHPEYYMRVRLFKNDHTPAQADTLADYTEADFTGYAESARLATPTISTDAFNRARASFPNVTFTCTSSSPANDVYGYYVWNESTNELFWAERFPSAPLAMNAPGAEIVVVPRITCTNEV